MKTPVFTYHVYTVTNSKNNISMNFQKANITRSQAYAAAEKLCKRNPLVVVNRQHTDPAKRPDDVQPPYALFFRGDEYRAVKK